MYHFLHVDSGATVPPNTLGIEVTSPELAAQCDLGHVTGRLDPELFAGLTYSAQSRAQNWRGRDAIDIATEIPLPPAGATLALGRVDLGTMAAAAVLVLRLLGRFEIPTGQVYSVRPIDRAQRITALSLRPAKWAPRPLPTPEAPWPADPRTWDEDRELAAVAAIARGGDVEGSDGSAASVSGGGTGLRGRPVGVGRSGAPVREQKDQRGDAGAPVAIVSCWLLDGEPNPDWGNAQRAHATQAYRGTGAAVEGVISGDAPADALWVSRHRVEASRKALAEEAARGVWVRFAPEAGALIRPGEEPLARDAKIAIVHSTHPDALELGFCVAPVVAWIQEANEVPEGEVHMRSDAGQQRVQTARTEVRADVASVGGRGAVDAPARRTERGTEGARSDSRSQVTIAGWAGPDGRTRYLDVDRLHERLWRSDERWTSTASTCQSPNSGTRLSEDTIVREVLACLR